MVSRLMRFNSENNWDIGYPQIRPARKLDMHRAHRESGLSSKVSLEGAFRRTVDWDETSQINGRHD